MKREREKEEEYKNDQNPKCPLFIHLLQETRDVVIVMVIVINYKMISFSL